MEHHIINIEEATEIFVGPGLKKSLLRIFLTWLGACWEGIIIVLLGSFTRFRDAQKKKNISTNFLGPKFFWTQYFFGIKSCRGIFIDGIFVPKYFWNPNLFKPQKNKSDDTVQITKEHDSVN